MEDKEWITVCMFVCIVTMVFTSVFLENVNEMFAQDVPTKICKELYGPNAYFYDNEVGTNNHLYCKNETERINKEDNTIVQLVVSK